jgi:CDP-diacylglycerol---glycerol-3-phosphate 3-phosphatidyltransferase
VHTAQAVFPVNAPNVLTLARILLVPVLVVALLDQTDHGDLLAAIAFALASLTDAIDGYLARSRNAITTFGKLMDPVADKLLIVAALFSLVSLHRLAPWVAMVIVAREFAVTMTRMAAAPTGLVIASNWWGKAKTIVQVATIFLLIAFDSSPLWLDLLTYGMVAITVVSGVDYFFGLRRLMREAEDRRVRALT